MAPIVRDAWNSYTYRFGEGERCVVSFDVSACEQKNQPPSAGRRVIGFSLPEQIAENGMPSVEAFRRLKAIEGHLVQILEANGVGCWLVGRQVYRGMRELVFQVADVDGFEQAYAAVEAEFGGMALMPYEDWQFYNDTIRPGVIGQNHIANREVLAALKASQSNFGEAHLLEHTFHGPAEALAVLEAGLCHEGFLVTHRTAGSLTLGREECLNPDDQDDLDDLTLALRDRAAALEVDYAGWSTNAVPAR